MCVSVLAINTKQKSKTRNKKKMTKTPVDKSSDGVSLSADTAAPPNVDMSLLSTVHVCAAQVRR